MATVIDRQMATLDVKDVPGSLNTIESYIRYLAERIDFSNSVTRRKLADTGVEGIEQIQTAITEINGELSGLKSTLSGMSGKITAIEGRLTDIESRLSALEGNE